jgi:hypothetical protein
MITRLIMRYAVVRRTTRDAALLSVALALGVPAQANEDPKIITAVVCDTVAQIEGFAEAHTGAHLSVREAVQTVNKAARKDDACSAVSDLIVTDVRDEKHLAVGGNALMVKRVKVLGILLDTPVGVVAQPLPAVDQFILAATKDEEI